MFCHFCSLVFATILLLNTSDNFYLAVPHTCMVALMLWARQCATVELLYHRRCPRQETHVNHSLFGNNSRPAHLMYGLYLPKKVWIIEYQRVMGMLKFSRIPTWEMENPMGYRGVWVIRSMGYEGVDCLTSTRDSSSWHHHQLVSIHHGSVMQLHVTIHFRCIVIVQ